LLDIKSDIKSETRKKLMNTLGIVVVLFLSISTVAGFTSLFSKFKYASSIFASTTVVDVEKSWQEDLDIILNVDTPCETRNEKLSEILKKADSIVSDVREAVQERNVTKLAPTNLGGVYIVN